MNNQTVHVVGAGLAGCEAAYFLASRGHRVKLHEMRPEKSTPAHQSASFAELVCSNSFKSKVPASAPGILKHEMQALGSLVLATGLAHELPGGDALTVDRRAFSLAITERLASHPLIELVRGEVSEPFPGAITLLATGPLTSDQLAHWLHHTRPQSGTRDWRFAGFDPSATSPSSELYFYDAIAPIVEASSLDESQTFLANRYEKGGEAAYLNCPLSESEYRCFWEALVSSECVPPRVFEKEIFFQGCQPIEAIAATGLDSLRFGPMKPVGLVDPRTGELPFAALQLRQENSSKSAYNLVGFQTKLKYRAQSEVFRLIPALKNAEFLRMGSIHRNTYICGPAALRADLSLRGHPLVYLAGQLTGVEGYLESAACGLLAGLFIAQRLQGVAHQLPPANTALGSLLRHITGGDPKSYAPTNIHFGLFNPQYFTRLQGLEKADVRAQIAAQAAESFARWQASSREVSEMTAPRGW